MSDKIPIIVSSSDLCPPSLTYRLGGQQSQRKCKEDLRSSEEVCWRALYSVSLNSHSLVSSCWIVSWFHFHPFKLTIWHRADPVFHAQIEEGGVSRWDHYPKIIDDLKVEARKLGLWNMFLPKGHYKESPGFTNLEYGLMAEYLGKSRCASEAVNCAAPDTGNMEVLAKYGNDAQKKQWLKPLMEGEIRSAFLMTEPDIASSDATNIQMSMKQEGNEWVLNGQVSWYTNLSNDRQCSNTL